jgi:hypothetical protein
MTVRHLAIAALTLALAAPALGEERQTDGPAPPPANEKAATSEPAPPAGPTMRELLNEGYEIKSTSIVPHDIVKRGGSTTDVDAAIIVLQKGPAIATCYTVFTSLTDGSLVTLPCNVYK